MNAKSQEQGSIVCMHDNGRTLDKIYYSILKEREGASGSQERELHNSSGQQEVCG